MVHTINDVDASPRRAPTYGTGPPASSRPSCLERDEGAYGRRIRGRDAVRRLWLFVLLVWGIGSLQWFSGGVWRFLSQEHGPGAGSQPLRRLLGDRRLRTVACWGPRSAQGACFQRPGPGRKRGRLIVLAALGIAGMIVLEALR